MRIIHTYFYASSFILKDKQLFESIATVKNNYFNLAQKYLLPFNFIKQLLFLLFYGWRTDLFICQFSGYHSFLPCLFARVTGKKSIIISGGTDCVSFPGIRYGNFYRPVLKTFTKWSYQLCSHLAPKHETLYFTKYDYDEKEPAEQGIKAFIKGLNTPYTAIPNGYDPEQWPLLHKERKPMSFITLSGSFEYPFQVALKGIDLILEVAALFPDCTFTIAGVPEWKKLDIKSNNVMVLPPIRHKDLPELFNEYEYYMQLSMAEGFPNALCEAMLCGCIPIVSNVFSMPEIVGECGYILKKRNFSDLQNLLIEIKGREPVSRKSIREIIEKKYTYNERKNKFQQFFKKMTTPNPL